MFTVELTLDVNEASDVLLITDPRVLAEYEADAVYVVTLDEGHVEGNLRLLIHHQDQSLHEGWRVVNIPADAGRETLKTDDPEASAVYDGYVYLVGSHYGKKRGPLHPSRAWIARFPISELLSDTPVRLEVIRNKFRLHRLINDALADADLDIVHMPAEYEAAFVTAAKERAQSKGKKYAPRLHEGDRPMNIEAASFRDNGNLLLGLRFPTTENGAPVMVELAGVPGLFEGKGWPTVANVWALDGPGARDRMVGFRAITHSGPDKFHAVLGNLDATSKPSLLLEYFPGGASATSEHWEFSLEGNHAGGCIPAVLHSRFATEAKIEGLALAPDGHMLYVVDEDDCLNMHFLKIGD